MSENKKTYVDSNVAAAKADAVATMIDALKGTAGLNAKVIYGCRYLQVRIHSSIVTECNAFNANEVKQKRITADVFKWEFMNGKCSALQSVQNLIQNAEIPLWARRYIVRFFVAYVGLPIAIKTIGGKTVFAIELDKEFSLNSIQTKQSMLERQWNKIEEGAKPNCIGNSYPDIIPEDDKHLKAPNARKQKSTQELIEAFGKKMRAVEDNADANVISEVIDFLFKEEDSKEIHGSKLNLLLMITKATNESRKSVTKYMSNGMKMDLGTPTAPGEEESK